MTLSRTHLAMLAVVSLFTGIIAPVVHDTMSTYPFPLTSMQVLSYVILTTLGLIFLMVSMNRWGWARFLGGIILLSLGYLLWVTASGGVLSLESRPLSGYGWGWFFLAIGVILLLWSMLRIERVEQSEFSIFDRIVGILGIGTIFFLTLMIILVSFPRRGSNYEVLMSVFGSGKTETRTGIVLSPSYPSIEKLSYDRARDTLHFYTTSGASMISFPEGKAFERLPYGTTTLGDVQYTISASGLVLSNSGTPLGVALLPQDITSSILFKTGNTLSRIDDSGIVSYTGGSDMVKNIITTQDKKHTFWLSHTASGQMLYRDGIAVSRIHPDILLVNPSSDGVYFNMLVRDASGALSIWKDDTQGEILREGYIEGTLRLNGRDSIYATERDGIVQMVYNGAVLDQKLDEVRDIYLDDDSTGYAYFGRPLGEKNYCLYTRYRGNLCGLSGYMNPRKGADGSSLIFAGLKDGTWSIYRNVTSVVQNTGYTKTQDISRDYVFYDLTEPKYYIFISAIGDKYRLYKRGSYIDGIWQDVGLDTAFGYDGKIIMSVKDESGWRVIEI